MSLPLYATEAQIAHRLGYKLTTWKANAHLFEREGMPAIDPLSGRRYWPAIQKWFDARHGVTEANVPGAIDGPENF